jgi:hypothetical protein
LIPGPGGGKTKGRTNITVSYHATAQTIPWVLHQRWGIFTITASDILLAFATGALPQWKAEKWGSCHAEKSTILTCGNGAQHALVIIGHKDFLDLEVLANINPKVSPFTRFCTVVLTLLWLVHLVALWGREEDFRYLMVIGEIGMVVGWLPQRPEVMDLPLEFKDCIAEAKVIKTLKRIEVKYPRVGAAMVGTFFPGKMRGDEERWWTEKAAKYKE